PGQNTASAPPARSARCRSTLAKPRSSYGSRRRRANASAAGTRPPATSSRSACSLSGSIAPGAAGAEEQEVGGARLEAGEVEGHVHVAELPEPGDDLPVAILVPQSRHLVGRQLQTCEAVVMPHAELAEAQAAHERLGGVDGPQLVRGDPVAVLEPR